ncbi:MAG TPA: phage tail protein [Terriglobales bacterium]|nr:phage tail protein [Terriglobales bacterium]
MPAAHIPLHVFRFHVEFRNDLLVGQAAADPVAICQGAFSECTGLEATMEAKTIKEGGRNYGAALRAGATTFATVVLKRGISTSREMYAIFNTFATGTFAPRLQVTINVFNIDGAAVRAWQLQRAMPVKFKFADLNARGTEVGIEELHLAHEGLFSVAPTRQTL